MDYPKSVPGIGLVNGKFVDENTTTGTPGSLIPSTWGNSLTDELLNVIQAGGLEPSEVERDQLLEAIRALIETRVNDAAALPVGSMVPFPKGVVPPGFLEVNGSVQSIATYPDLAAYLGTTFNTGSEGVGNFRLPESRGEFLRGWDHGRGVDAGRLMGSWQDSDNKAHAHASTAGTGWKVLSSDGVTGSGLSGGTGSRVSYSADIANSGGSEARPRNLAVMWCIKAWSSAISEGVIDIAALALEVQKQKPIAIVGGHKNLVLSASGLSAVVNVSADQLIVGSGELVRSLSGINLSFSGLSVGANGLDTGVLANSTWYSAWVISNGISNAGLLSLSATTPSLPAGYTHKARVGWIRTDATANKFPFAFYQVGRRVQYRLTVGSNVTTYPRMAAQTTGVGPVWTPVSTDAFVPSTALSIAGFSVSISGSNSGVISVAPNNLTTPGTVPAFANPMPLYMTANGLIGSLQFDFMLEGANIYWCGAGGSNANVLACQGWEDSL